MFIPDSASPMPGRKFRKSKTTIGRRWPIRKILRCRSNELLKLWDASTNGQKVVDMPTKWYEQNLCTNDRMNQWIPESMNPWINESMNQYWFNEWINESVNQWRSEWVSRWINESANEWMDELATSWLSYFFTERPLRWGTSSLSYFFSEQPLIWASSSLTLLCAASQLALL